MFITSSEFPSGGSHRTNMVELPTRDSHFYATFATAWDCPKPIRDYFMASWDAVEEMLQQPSVERLTELQFVTPPVACDGKRTTYQVASVWRSTVDDASNEPVFVFRLATGEELIEGEWTPNLFLGVRKERELVLNLVEPPEPRHRAKEKTLPIRLRVAVGEVLRAKTKHYGDFSKIFDIALRSLLNSNGVITRIPQGRSHKGELEDPTSIAMTQASYAMLKAAAKRHRASMNSIVNSAFAHWLESQQPA
jgi:hypothetical protein